MQVTERSEWINLIKACLETGSIPVSRQAFCCRKTSVYQVKYDI